MPAEAGLASELAVSGPAESRVATDAPADLVIFYGGEEKGSLEPCGCPHRPRGGVARFARYVDAARQAEPALPSLVVNGGYWLEDAMDLDGSARADVPVLNGWMVQGLQQLGVDALNVGYNDVAGLVSLGALPDLPLVSANVVGPGIQSHISKDLGGRRVAVTGITAQGLTFLPTPGYQVGQPEGDAHGVLEGLRANHDLVVLLAFGAPEAARAHAEAGLVDVVIDTNLHRERYAPIWVGDAVWVRSHYGSMRLGELRLGMKAEGGTTALDRKVDLDPDLGEDAALIALTRAARVDINAVQQAAFGEVIGSDGLDRPAKDQRP